MHFINDLINLVFKKYPEVNAIDRLVLNHQDISEFSAILAKFIREINLFRVGSSGQIDWHFGNLHGGVAGFSNLELYNIISNKKNKLNIYNKTKWDELWLLIYSSNESPASTGSFVADQVRDLAERNIDLLSNSGFDKVWYYSSFSESIAFQLHPI